MRKLAMAAPAVISAHLALFPISEPLRKCINITDSDKQLVMVHASRKQESDPALRSIPRRTDMESARVQEMLRGLAAPDPRTREAAARAFRSVHEARAVEPLRRLLSDGDALVRISASEALYNNGDRRGVQVLIGILQNESERNVRAQAAASLGRIGEDEAVPALIEAAGGSGRVRIEAVQALGMIGDARAPEALAQIIRSSGGGLRRAALRAIGQTGTIEPRIIRQISDILSSADIATRIAAANALRLCGSRECIPALIEAFAYSVRGNDPDQQRDPDQPAAESPGAYGVRNEAIAAVVEIVRRNPQAIEPLMAALGDQRDSVRMNAAKALGRIGNVRAVPGLIDLLRRDRDDYVRMAAAEALGLIGDPRAVPALIERVNQEGGDLTSQRSIAVAAEALGRLGDRRAVPALRDALMDRSEIIRMAAVTSLGILGDPAAVPALNAILQRDPFPALRAAAALALGRVGGSEAEAALSRISDDNPSVGVAAERALRGLRARR
jgi:HEAT repeat protein